MKIPCVKINNLGFNYNYGNKSINFSSLPCDTFCRSNTSNTYKYDGSQYYIKHPLGKDNNYTLYYDFNIVRDSMNKSKLPYPPSRIKFEKPVDIAQLADVCNNYYYNCEDDNLYNKEQFNILKSFVSGNDKLKEEKIVSVINAFANTIVLELENNRVLKMVKSDPFPNRTFDSELDIPLLSDVYNYDNYYIFVQEKAETDDITDEDVDEMVERIKQRGYTPFDINSITGDMQIGWSPSLEKMMLIDTECARGQ